MSVSSDVLDGIDHISVIHLFFLLIFAIFINEITLQAATHYPFTACGGHIRRKRIIPTNCQDKHQTIPYYSSH
jgi:hypothetical protein